MFSACGDETKEEIEPAVPEVAQDSLTTIEAEFIFLADAAVLKGRSFIYGVEMDSVSRELIKKVEPLKRDEFDMVPVVVRAKVIENPRQEGWDEIAQIREILEIPERQTDSVEAPVINNN
ncbi:hypothetical protein SAMN04488034_101661 [Salinimicrobium catena]|uniref:NlpE C-terminal OB domain-containing protein n=2 Tax=Salinimicrobium catena TaxID=390640 RepID=A0A1H5J911_9FLAO|nr:hypothetical protein SAMN04488140_101660 [Salinimicrobium catena]SEE48747.1 hypothetical protein SAMN04488034_101661 [Salinimicrobium catena]